MDQLLILLMSIQTASMVFAGTPQEKAVAAVAVANAIREVATDRPALPDSTRRWTAKKPEDVVDGRESSLASTSHSVDGDGSSTRAFDRAVKVIAEAANRRAESRIEFKSETVDARLTATKRRATVYTGEKVYGVGWCKNCPGLKLKWGAGNAEIDIVWSDEKASGPQVYPAVRFHDGTEERYPANKWGDYKQISQLSELVELIDRAAPPRMKVAASGSAGAIHARSQISQALTWMQQFVGEGIKAELRWDRSGKQNFPLLAGGDWSAVALFGQSGRLQVSARGAKSLPVDAIGFAYRVDGRDFTVDLDAVMFKGLGEQLHPNQKSVGAPPSQVGILTVLSILSIAKQVFALLNPSVDLQLGGSVSASAVLSGDALTIDFVDCPSVRFVCLFTFHLTVKQVTITDRNVHVEFSGNRWIKSRDFEVR